MGGDFTVHDAFFIAMSLAGPETLTSKYANTMLDVILLTIKNFFRKSRFLKVIVILVIQTKEKVVGQLPTAFIVSTINS